MKKVKKRRIRYDKIFAFIIILGMFFYLLSYILNTKISNIYILNNSFLSDQYIIEKALISDYPKSIINPCLKIKKELENDIFIKKTNVYKKGLKSIYIEVEENRPLFYYEHDKKTILLDGQKIDKIYKTPVVINYITDNYYDKFKEKMSNLDLNVLNRISEIQFKPNEVDDNRFFLTMNDGNYVYVNIDTFDKLNKYLTILESLPKKNGILYLDYGNNFEIIK